MLDTLRTLFAALGELHYEYAEQFAVALPMVVLTVVLHGQGMRLAGACYRRFGRPRGRRRHGPHMALLASVVSIMLTTHYLEVVAWALFYFQMGMVGDVQTAMYFSINAYTTLGASNIVLPGIWRGLDGFEAISAMLMFGWSTAVLAAVVMESHSLAE